MDVGNLYHELDLNTTENRARKPTTRRDMTEDDSDDDMDGDKEESDNDDDEDDEVCPD